MARIVERKTPVREPQLYSACTGKIIHSVKKWLGNKAGYVPRTTNIPSTHVVMSCDVTPFMINETKHNLGEGEAYVISERAKLILKDVSGKH